MQTQSSKKIKFATQANEEVLACLRQMAAEEGRHIQSLLDEALREYIDRKQGLAPKADVLEALGASMAEYDKLYEALSK